MDDDDPMTAEGQDEEGASGGRPATRDGDLEITIVGYVYVLSDGSVNSGATEGGTSGEAAEEPEGEPAV